MASFSSSNVSAVQVRRRLAVIALALGVLTLVGLIVLWPRGAAPDLRPTGVTVHYVDATVVSSEPSTCGLAQEAPQDCQKVTARVTSGAQQGQHRSFRDTRAASSTRPLSAPGTRSCSSRTQAPIPSSDTRSPTSSAPSPSSRLFVLFAIVVIAFGRWQGLRALAGLVASLAAVLIFLLPSLLRGNPALPVAIVASFLIAYIALYLAHGVNPNTTVALLGTLAALVVTAGLAALFVDLARHDRPVRRSRAGTPSHRRGRRPERPAHRRTPSSALSASSTTSPSPRSRRSRS